MKLLFYIMVKTDLLDEVLAELAKNDVHGATVVGGRGMAKLLSSNHDEDELPFLGTVRAFLQPEHEQHDVLLIALPEAKVPVAISAIEAIVGDLTLKNNGVAFTVPVDYSKGLF